MYAKERVKTGQGKGALLQNGEEVESEARERQGTVGVSGKEPQKDRS